MDYGTNAIKSHECGRLRIFDYIPHYGTFNAEALSLILQCEICDKKQGWVVCAQNIQLVSISDTQVVLVFREGITTGDGSFQTSLCLPLLADNSTALLR